MKGTCFLFAAVVSLSAACATNPVTGKKQMSLLSEAEELAIGQQQDQEIRREMGVYDDPNLQRYVNEIGQELASHSHRPNLPWSFTIVDIVPVDSRWRLPSMSPMMAPSETETKRWRVLPFVFSSSNARADRLNIVAPRRMFGSSPAPV